MPNNHPRTSAAGTAPPTLVRWEFAKGPERIVCQVAREAGRFFNVAVLPSREVGRATASLFGDVVSALRCHALLAAGLRDNGWKLVAYKRAESE